MTIIPVEFPLLCLTTECVFEVIYLHNINFWAKQSWLLAEVWVLLSFSVSCTVAPVLFACSVSMKVWQSLWELPEVHSSFVCHRNCRMYKFCLSWTFLHNCYSFFSSVQSWWPICLWTTTDCLHKRTTMEPWQLSWDYRTLTTCNHGNWPQATSANNRASLWAVSTKYAVLYWNIV